MPVGGKRHAGWHEDVSPWCVTAAKRQAAVGSEQKELRWAAGEGEMAGQEALDRKKEGGHAFYALRHSWWWWKDSAAAGMPTAENLTCLSVYALLALPSKNSDSDRRTNNFFYEKVGGISMGGVGMVNAHPSRHFASQALRTPPRAHAWRRHFVAWRGVSGASLLAALRAFHCARSRHRAALRTHTCAARARAPMTRRSPGSGGIRGVFSFAPPQTSLALYTHRTPLRHARIRFAFTRVVRVAAA